MGDQRERYRFGSFELDALALELRRGDEVVAIEPRVLDVLVYLARHRDRVVTREELVDAVWPGTFITDSALAQAVLKARRAVDDDGRRQGVIRTVHGRGLRFVAEVAGDVDREVVAEAAVAERPLEPLRWRRWPLLAVAAAAVAAVVAASAWLALGRTGPTGVRRLAVLPFDNQTGEATLEWVEQGLPRLIGRVIEEGGGVELVADDALADALQRLPEDRKAPLDRSVFEDLQRAFGITHAVVAGVRREGDLYRLGVEVWSRGKRPRRIELAGAQVPEMLEPAAREVRRRVVGHRDDAPAPVRLSDDPFVNQLYAMGLQEYARDNYRGAESYFKVCLDREPDLTWARYEIAVCRRRLGSWEESLALCREVLDAAGTAGDWRLQNAVLSNMGVAAWRLGDLEGAERHYLAALAIADANGLRDRQASVLLNLGILDADRGRLDRAEVHERRALALFREMGSASGEANALNSLGVLAWRRGDLASSREMHERALAIRRELGMKERAAASLNNLGTIARATGRWDEASRLFDEALAVRRELGDRLGEATTLYNLAVMALLRSDPSGARRLSEQSLEIARELGNRRRVAWNLGFLASVERAEGRREEAASRAEAALAAYRAMGDRRSEAEQLLALAGIALERGDRVRAERFGGMAREIANELGDLALEGAEARLRGKLALAAGDPDGAEAHYQTALAAAREVGNTFDAMTTAVDLGGLLLDRGRSAEAASLVDDVGPFGAAHPPAMLLLARLRAGSGDPTAVELARRAREVAGPLWTDEQAAILAAIERTGPAAGG